MKIELKNIKFSESLSEETSAFTADMYINGIKVGYAKNTGQGGSTNYYAYDAKHWPLIREAEEHCKALPPIDYGSFFQPMDLEGMINMIFEDWLKVKEKAKMDKKLQKAMLKGLCFNIRNGYEMMCWKGFTLAQVLEHPKGRQTIKDAIAKLRAEGREILNTNLPAEILEISK